ncbi:unnamed protein product [Caenorhabditis auriculariae]|uniref:Uncharacterized protein n=1 Tax=Caenorhabditis auriculariae TaxID=2777116 RepID=A0A8S1GUN2_9PELO|nr:unnamed protein product [Caenorhabditis auriculariae]
MALPIEPIKSHNQRLFVYLLGSDGMVSEFVEEDEIDWSSRAWSDVILRHDGCNCDEGPDSEFRKEFDDVTAAEKPRKWLRLVPFMVQAKE